MNMIMYPSNVALWMDKKCTVLLNMIYFLYFLTKF